MPPEKMSFESTKKYANPAGETAIPEQFVEVVIEDMWQGDPNAAVHPLDWNTLDGTFAPEQPPIVKREIR